MVLFYSLAAKVLKRRADAGDGIFASLAWGPYKLECATMRMRGRIWARPACL